jgi:predicted nucleic acid-binding Zn ribbon protein
MSRYSSHHTCMCCGKPCSEDFDTCNKCFREAVMLARATRKAEGK